MKTKQTAQFMAKIMHVLRNSENGLHIIVLNFAGFALVMLSYTHYHPLENDLSGISE